MNRTLKHTLTPTLATSVKYITPTLAPSVKYIKVGSVRSKVGSVRSKDGSVRSKVVCVVYRLHQ